MAGDTGTDDAKESNKARFELELEFVQALANPFYLQSLAAQNILDDPAFINYLAYLQYFKERDYAQFLHYPHALHHLDLLQHAEFRATLKREESFREFLHQKQFDHWRTWRQPNVLNPDGKTPSSTQANGNGSDASAPPVGAST